MKTAREITILVNIAGSYAAFDAAHYFAWVPDDAVQA